MLLIWAGVIVFAVVAAAPPAARAALSIIPLALLAAALLGQWPEVEAVSELAILAAETLVLGLLALWVMALSALAVGGFLFYLLIMWPAKALFFFTPWRDLPDNALDATGDFFADLPGNCMRLLRREAR